MRSGKSTVAQMLIDDYGFERLSFAAPLKREVLLMGFPQQDIEDKPPYMRQLLIALGMARRAIHPSYWVDALHEHLQSRQLNQQELFVCDDCRFMNEIAYFKELSKSHRVTFVRIERQYEEPQAAPLQDPSETALDRYDGFDHVITAASGDVPGLLEQVRGALGLAEQLELPFPDGDTPAQGRAEAAMDHE